MTAIEENHLVRCHLFTPAYEENMSSPGVLRSDFARVEANALDDSPPSHRFMTTADWPDMESFRAAFYAPAMQKSLQESFHMRKDPLFLVSEILVAETNADK